jgi:hypothetical protein
MNDVTKVRKILEKMSDPTLERIVQEDINNKLTPFKNLIATIELNFKDRDSTSLSETEKFILDGLESCQNSLGYLSNGKIFLEAKTVRFNRLVNGISKEEMQRDLESAIPYEQYERERKETLSVLPIGKNYQEHLENVISFEQYKQECRDGKRVWGFNYPMDMSPREFGNTKKKDVGFLGNLKEKISNLFNLK